MMSHAEGVSLAKRLLKDADDRKNEWLDTYKNNIPYKLNPQIINAYTDYNGGNTKRKHIIPLIQVKDCDPIVLNKTLVAKSYKTLLATSACSTNKGGGVREGSASREADLCRRTNYWKALKGVSNNIYPLQPGTFIYFKNITVIKNSKGKRIKNNYSVDVLSVVLPRRPNVMYIGNQETYENNSDKINTKKCLKQIFHLAKENKYSAVILSYLACNQEKHPMKEFLEILLECINASGVERVFVLAPKGATTGEGVDDRNNYIKYCSIIDNTGEEHSDCEPPKKEYDDLNAGRRSKAVNSDSSSDSSSSDSDSDSDSDSSSDSGSDSGSDSDSDSDSSSDSDN